MFVTTSYHPDEEEIVQAKQLSLSLGWPFVERLKYSLADLYSQTRLTQVIIVSKVGWRYEQQDGYRFAFHPNMSALRIKQMIKGQKDSMIECSGMKAGDQVLDCTMGLAADAIVSSYIVGQEGRVVALESQSVIAHLVRQGLKTYQTDQKELARAMQSIEVIEADYRPFLMSCKDQSFDIVLFDPMFRQTVKGSPAMQQLKPLANPSSVDQQSVLEAVRVARKAVLLKERKESVEFSKLGFSVIKEASSYAWGVWNKEGN